MSGITGWGYWKTVPCVRTYEDGNRELLAITGSEEWQRIRRDYLGDIANETAPQTRPMKQVYTGVCLKIYPPIP